MQEDKAFDETLLVETLLGGPDVPTPPYIPLSASSSFTPRRSA
jgi:hypothetical protein